MERQKTFTHIDLAATGRRSQKGFCPSLQRTPLFNAQALNEFAQLKVLHHFPLCAVVPSRNENALPSLSCVPAALFYLKQQRVRTPTCLAGETNKRRIAVSLIRHALCQKKSHAGAVLPCADAPIPHPGQRQSKGRQTTPICRRFLQHLPNRGRGEGDLSGSVSADGAEPDLPGQKMNTWQCV